jgi:hypothetical protein
MLLENEPRSCWIESNAASLSAPAKHRFKFERGVADYIHTEEEAFVKVVSTSGRRRSAHAAGRSRDARFGEPLVRLPDARRRRRGDRRVRGRRGGGG